MQVTPAVLSVLERGLARGPLFFLPQEQLDRKLYTSVNQVLECLGGKWDRRQKAHVFPHPIEERLSEVLSSGVVTNRKQELGFFETPRGVAEELVQAARIQRGMKVLEPSAGRGAIAKTVYDLCYPVLITCGDIDPEHCRYLEQFLDRFYTVIHVDFLKTQPEPDNPQCEPLRYDRVVMNPPFAVPGNPQADLDHVRHAYGWLKSGGRLVSVLSAGIEFRENRKSVEFREWVESLYGNFHELPEGAFRASGTDVRTCYVVLEKP